MDPATTDPRAAGSSRTDVDPLAEELAEALARAAARGAGDAEGATELRRAHALALDPRWDDDHPLRVEALLRWAEARARFDAAEAEATTTTALEMAERLGLVDATVADLWLLRAALRKGAGDAEGVLHDATRSLRAFAALDRLDAGALESVDSLASLLALVGAVDRAAEAHELGYAHVVDPRERARWLARRVDRLASNNDLEAALALLDEELDAVDPDVATRLRLANARVIALDRLGRRVEAARIAEAALADTRDLTGEEGVQAALLLDTYGVLLSKQGRTDEAAAIRERLSATEGLPGWLEASNLENHAYLLAKLGEIDAARAKYLRAVERTLAEYGHAHAEVSRVLSQVGVFELRHGDSADEWLRLAAESVELTRLQVDDPYTRARFHEAGPYALQALVALGRDDADRAWRAMERSTGSVTLELCADRGDVQDRRRRSKLLRTMHRERFDARLDAAFGRPARDPERLARYAAAYEELVDELAETAPWLHGSRGPEHVQALLEPDQAIVGWLVHHNHDLDPAAQHAWVLRHEGPVRVVHLGVVGDMFNPHERAGRALVESARSPFGGDDAHVADAKALAEGLVHPLLSSLEGVRRLVVCPSDVLLHVPVECLPDPEGRPLLERFDVSYAPSASVWAYLTERTVLPKNRGRALLVGDPPFRPEHVVAMRREEEDPSSRPERRSAGARGASLDALPRLPASRREVAAVGELYDRATVLVGEAASEAALVALARDGRLAEFGTLHLASHARIDQARPTESLLALERVARAGGQDGLVTVAEILDGWNLNADLVVLSACETASGRRSNREGLFGFSQALFAAGARSVVASKWQVDDRASELLMRRFHELLRGRHGAPRTKARALAEAKRWLRAFEDERGDRPFAHPSTWAAFVLLGASD